MAINKNHEFEDLAGVRCAIVERNVTAEREAFLRALLEHNKYTVITVPVEPKASLANAAPPAQGTPPAGEQDTAQALFTVAVTDVMFNATNAIFGRLLKTREGHVVTLAYWRQQDRFSQDQVPYYETGF